jgi:hypothetical protein
MFTQNNITQNNNNRKIKMTTTEDKTQKELLKELKELVKLQAKKQSDNKKELRKTLQELTEKIKENPNMYGWQVSEKFNISMQLEYTKASRKFNNRIHLLAYGFLRGMPYLAMENTTQAASDAAIKYRAKHVYVIYTAHFATDNRIQKLTEQDIYAALLNGGNDGS